MPDLYLFNSIANKIQKFVPIDRNLVKMYVCGPTVYGDIHIGNLRSIVIADVLYRVLLLLFSDVQYVRNVTDVDDKIIAKAKEMTCKGREVAELFYSKFRNVCNRFNCLPPTVEPKASEFIDEIIIFIQKLIDNGHAYESSGSVYFNVASYPEYGVFSKHQEDDLLHGFRISVLEGKESPADFALWKAIEENETDLSWNSPWSVGRPGWHIECSAMSTKILGPTFDIHCGGMDLKFPHHENEIAQNKCAFKDCNFANLWMHIEMLKIDGKKMSKSFGEIVKANETKLQDNCVRIAMLLTHYRKPLNWDDERIVTAKKIAKDLDRIANLIGEINKTNDLNLLPRASDIKSELGQNFIEALCKDLNTHEAFRILKIMIDQLLKKNDLDLGCDIILLCNILGIWSEQSEELEHANTIWIETLINRRSDARQINDFKTSDDIRDQLNAEGIEIFDWPNGKTTWRIKP